MFVADQHGVAAAVGNLVEANADESAKGAVGRHRQRGWRKDQFEVVACRADAGRIVARRN
jgi:hypothetical protein